MVPATWLAVATALTLANPIVLKAPDPIAGVVVDEGGRPVEGVLAMLIGSVPGGHFGPHWRGRTDAAGRFQADQSGWFAAGPVPGSGYPDVLAYRPGSRVARVKVNALDPPRPDRPVRLVLRPASGVNIRVVGPDGKPVGRAIVAVRESSFAASGELGIPDATTDADGRARFADLSPDDLFAFEVSSPDFGVQYIADASLATLERNLVLEPIGRISGRVAADDPARAGGVSIVGFTTTRAPFDGWRRASGPIRTTTDADGRFDVPRVVAGSILFFGLAPADDVVLIPQRGATLVPGGRTEVEFRLKRGIPVRGTIRERGTGRPIAGASLFVSSRSGPAGSVSSGHQARSDASGRFLIHLLPGQIGFRLTYAGGYSVPADTLGESYLSPLATLPEGSDGLDLPSIELVRSIDVRGVIVDESGKSAAGARVMAWTPQGSSVAGAPSLTLLADDRGEFVAKGVTPGMPIEWSAALGDSASEPPSPIVADASKPIRLVIGPGHTMSLGGRVLDDDGRPIVGAALTVYSRHMTRAGGLAWHYPSEQGHWNLRTDAEGRFQTPRQLPAGALHRAEARAIGKKFADTGWIDSTAKSFPDIVMAPLAAQSNRPNP